MNPSKIRGIKRGYQRLLGLDVEVIAVAVESGVSSQPLSLEETLRGAINRATRALHKVGDAVHGVGVEAGFIEVDKKVLDVQVAVIADHDGCITIGMSPAFQIPRKFIEKIVNLGLELENVVDEYFKTHRVGEKGGFISILTRGVVTREELTEMAIIMALVPRLWKELYELRSRY